MEIKMRGTTLEDFHGIVDGEIVQHLKTNGFSFIDAGRRRSLVKKTQAQEKVKGFVGKAVKGEGAEAKAEWTEFSGGLVKKTLRKESAGETTTITTELIDYSPARPT